MSKYITLIINYYNINRCPYNCQISMPLWHNIVEQLNNTCRNKIPVVMSNRLQVKYSRTNARSAANSNNLTGVPVSCRESENSRKRSRFCCRTNARSVKNKSADFACYVPYRDLAHWQGHGTHSWNHFAGNCAVIIDVKKIDGRVNTPSGHCSIAPVNYELSSYIIFI